MEKIISYLLLVKDPRQVDKLTYPLAEIIVLVLLAILGSAEDWGEFEIFGKANLDLLRKYFPSGTVLRTKVRCGSYSKFSAPM